MGMHAEQMHLECTSLQEAGPVMQGSMRIGAGWAPVQPLQGASAALATRSWGCPWRHPPQLRAHLALLGLR